MSDFETRKSRRVLWLIGGLATGALGDRGWTRSPRATELLGVLADPDEVYNPVSAGQPLPGGYRQLLRRAAILPV